MPAPVSDETTKRYFVSTYYVQLEVCPSESCGPVVMSRLRESVLVQFEGTVDVPWPRLSGRAKRAKRAKKACDVAILQRERDVIDEWFASS